MGSIQIIKRDESGYITELILDGKSISGDELAVGIALPSSNFSISREGGDCVFNVKRLSRAVPRSDNSMPQLLLRPALII